MSDAILVLNAGSSSIKFSVFPGHMRPSRQGLTCDGECEGIGHRKCMFHLWTAQGADHRTASAPAWPSSCQRHGFSGRKK